MEVIFFDSDINSMGQESIEVIDRKVDALKDTPEFAITLEGYSDITGRADYNLELSEKRALLVKDSLVNLGIDADKIRVVGKGGTDKYGKGEVNEALQQNRRVNLIIDIPPEPKLEVQTPENQDLSQSSTPKATQEPIEEAPPSDLISKAEPSPPTNLSKTILKKVRKHASDGIVFVAPPEMVVGESYLVEAEISNSFVESLSKDLSDINIENKMGMKLSGHGFEIALELQSDQNEGPESENGIVEPIYDGPSLEWKWLVTPERGGIRSLLLSIVITAGNSESEMFDGEYATFQRVIEVRPNMVHAITSSYWIMGILIFLIITVVAWILIRKVRVD